MKKFFVAILVLLSSLNSYSDTPLIAQESVDVITFQLAEVRNIKQEILESEGLSPGAIGYPERIIINGLSPDGETIIFSNAIPRTSVHYICTYNLVNQESQCSNIPISDQILPRYFIAHWSPAGTNILLHRHNYPIDMRLILFDANTYDLTLLTDVAMYTNRFETDIDIYPTEKFPMWISDTQFYFWQTADLEPAIYLSNQELSLRLYDLNTMESQPIYTDPQTGQVDEISHSVLSPDGNQVAYIMTFSDSFWHYDLSTNENQQFMSFGELSFRRVEWLAWYPNNEQLMLALRVSNNNYSSLSRYMQFDLTTNTIFNLYPNGHEVIIDYSNPNRPEGVSETQTYTPFSGIWGEYVLSDLSGMLYIRKRGNDEYHIYGVDFDNPYNFVYIDRFASENRACDNTSSITYHQIVQERYVLSGNCLLRFEHEGTNADN